MECTADHQQKLSIFTREHETISSTFRSVTSLPVADSNEQQLIAVSSRVMDMTDRDDEVAGTASFANNTSSVSSSSLTAAVMRTASKHCNNNKKKKRSGSSHDWILAMMLLLLWSSSFHLSSAVLVGAISSNTANTATEMDNSYGADRY